MVAFSQLACHLRYALLIVCVLVVVILFSKWTGASTDNVTFLQGRRTSLEAKRTSVIKNLVVSAKQIYGNVQQQLQEMPFPTDEQRTFLVMQLAYALAYIDSAQMSCADIYEIENISEIDQLSGMIADISRLQQQLLPNGAGNSTLI